MSPTRCTRCGRAGVSLVAWQGLTDLPPTSSDTGRGLYTTSGRPKLTLQAFAFPVVASVRRGHGFVWGRAPVSRRVRVVVQRAVGNRWRTLVKIRSGSDGVFHAASRPYVCLYRAQVVGGPTSLPYDSKSDPAQIHSPGELRLISAHQFAVIGVDRLIVASRTAGSPARGSMLAPTAKRSSSQQETFRDKATCGGG